MFTTTTISTTSCTMSLPTYNELFPEHQNPVYNDGFFSLETTSPVPLPSETQNRTLIESIIRASLTGDTSVTSNDRCVPIPESVTEPGLVNLQDFSIFEITVFFENSSFFESFKVSFASTKPWADRAAEYRLEKENYRRKMQVDIFIRSIILLALAAMCAAYYDAYLPFVAALTLLHTVNVLYRFCFYCALSDSILI